MVSTGSKNIATTPNTRDWPAIIGLSILGIISVGLVIFQFYRGRVAQQDQRTLLDSQQIATSITEYATDHMELPKSLDELGTVCRTDYGSSRGIFSIGFDGQTAEACLGERLKQFEYRVVDSKKYELCANFVTKANGAGSVPVSGVGSIYDLATHPRGRRCVTVSEYSLENPTDLPLKDFKESL